jgi:hypothetical protein
MGNHERGLNVFTCCPSLALFAPGKFFDGKRRKLVGTNYAPLDKLDGCFFGH